MRPRVARAAPGGWVYHVLNRAVARLALFRKEDWRGGSLWVRRQEPAALRGLLHDWRVDRPREWGQMVNEPLSARELEAVRTSIERSRPLGRESWQQKTAARLGLLHTLRSEGRRKGEGGGGTRRENQVRARRARASSEGELGPRQ